MLAWYMLRPVFVCLSVRPSVFSYPTVSKQFPYSDALGHLAFTNFTAQNRDGQKLKKNIERFAPSPKVIEVHSEPHNTWHSDIGGPYRSCRPETFFPGNLSVTARARNRPCVGILLNTYNIE